MTFATGMWQTVSTSVKSTAAQKNVDFMKVHDLSGIKLKITPFLHYHNPQWSDGIGSITKNQ